MSNNKDSKQDSRLSSVETDIDWIKEELKKIRDNHLPHIYGELKCIRDDLNSRPSWLMTGLIAVLVALLSYVLAA